MSLGLGTVGAVRMFHIKASAGLSFGFRELYMLSYDHLCLITVKKDSQLGHKFRVMYKLTCVAGYIRTCPLCQHQPRCAPGSAQLQDVLAERPTTAGSG